MIQNNLPKDFFKCDDCGEICDLADVVCNCNPANDSVYLKIIKDECVIAVCPNCEYEIIRFPFTKKKASK